jgi:hypothetical protein
MKSLYHVVAATDDCGEPRIFWDAKSREADESNPGTTAACRFCHAIHHQRLQRPSNRQIPNSSPRTLLLQEFRRGLEIARPLKPLNALMPLMITWRTHILGTRIWANRIWVLTAYLKSITTSLLSAASASISGFSGPAIAKFPTVPDEPDWFSKNFGEVWKSRSR